MVNPGDTQETKDVVAEQFAALFDQARRSLSAAPGTALALTERCVALARSTGRPRDEAGAWRVRGQALRAMGQHQQAIDAFASAANAALVANDPLLAAQVQLGAIDSLTMLGRGKEAAALAAELIRRFTEEESPLDAAKALCNLGSLYLRQDRYADALNCYTEADIAFEQSEASAGVGSMALMRALVSVNRALALTHLNDVEAALRLYEAALRTYIDSEMEGEAAVVETNIAFLRHVSGWHAAALAHLNRAHAVFTAHGKTHEIARCDIDRGEAYRSLNLFPEALECYERAVATFETLPLEYDHARAELGKAATLFALSRVDDSLKSLDHAETVFRKLRNRSQEAHVHLIRAGWLQASGRSEEARPLAVQAARAFTRRRLFGWAAEARLLVAAIDDAQGRDATRRLRSVSRTARQTKRGWLECRAEQALGLAARRRGDAPQALLHFRQGIAVLESARTLAAPDEVHVAYLSDKMGIYSEAVSLLLEQGQPKDIEEALDYAERSRSRLLLDRLSDAQERPPNPGDAEGNLAALRGALARAQQGGDAPDGTDPRRFLDPPPDQIARLEQAYTEALRAIQLDEAVLSRAGRLRELVTSQEPVRLSSLQASLQVEETLVSFYRLPGAFVAFLITARGVKAIPVGSLAGRHIACLTPSTLSPTKNAGQLGRKQGLFLLRETLCAEWMAF
jgi:tetratricopeptide (TPR) repeat protein